MRPLLRIVIGAALGCAALYAVAAVVMRQPVFGSKPFRGSVRADAAVLRQHVEFLTTTVRPRDAAHPENLEVAARYIEGAFARAGGRVSSQPFDAGDATYRNVIASFGPHDDRRPLLVIGAHYDAFSMFSDLPGADDNASGTAGLLELARLFGASPPRTPVALVAYTTEEPPFFGSERMGSAVHAASLQRGGRAVAGMICLEMIGYFAAEQRYDSWVLRALYPKRGDFIAVAGGWRDRALLRGVKKAMRGAGGVRVLSMTGPRAMIDASDQRNYWARGWPAVMITDTAYLRNANYHAATDVASTLDYARMARVVDGLFNAVNASGVP
jgi:Peptidase family M28